MSDIAEWLISMAILSVIKASVLVLEYVLEVYVMWLYRKGESWYGREVDCGVFHQFFNGVSDRYAAIGFRLCGRWR